MANRACNVGGGAELYGRYVLRSVGLVYKSVTKMLSTILTLTSGKLSSLFKISEVNLKFSLERLRCSMNLFSSSIP